ncbi:energy-coupling factor ABC transporter permease [Granulosicoccaceae sp. 1_MG-2023]|nr:energy-coupling factor ABC transporter permease [Granulosicoccaceae sp. 1_MG-2023]
MHIEAGVVDGAKMVLSYGTGAAALGWGLKQAYTRAKQEGAGVLCLQSLISTVLVFAFFEVLPHHPVGVSEVHLILGTSLLLFFGVAPAALGLAAGLLLQGLLFAPFDLPQYGINITTLLVPLYACAALAERIIPAGTAYADIGYSAVLRLSLAYQGGIIAWVAFWAFYGQGFGAANLTAVGGFGLAYMSVVLIEPLLDLALLAAAKQAFRGRAARLVQPRLLNGLS